MAQKPYRDRQRNPLPSLCVRTQSRLLDLLDGSVPHEEAHLLNRHLEECSRCRRERERCLQAEGALQSAAEHIPTVGDLRPEFYARLTESRPQRNPFGWRTAIPVLAMGIAGLILWRVPVFLPAPQVKTSRETTVVEMRPNPEKTSELAETAIPTQSEEVRKPLLTANSREKRSGIEAVGTQRPLPRYQMEMRRREPSSPPPIVVAMRYQTEDSEKLSTSLTDVPARISSKAATFGRTLSKSDAKRDAASTFDSQMPTTDNVPALPVQGSLADRSLQFAYAKADDAKTADSIDLKVEDDARGFTASAHVAAAVEESEEGHLVTIEAEGSP